MTARRFTDKPPLDPKAVLALPAGHPALVENRTLFPTTVVDVDEKFEGRLLVSGKNSRKLGETVAKGVFKGYALYQLSLEERATCPTDCAVRSFCYGNGTQLARRHRIVDFDYFALLLEDEIKEQLESHPGVLVRLHVLGDFPSAEYVAMWADLLDQFPTLAAYGYTHRATTKWGGDEIGDTIESVKDRFPQRFRIRWSGEVSRPDGAVVIDRVPESSRVAEGMVCPAQTDKSACCASCGLCWEQSFSKECIAFIKHGRHSATLTATEANGKTVEAVAGGAPAAVGLRPISAISLKVGVDTTKYVPDLPEMRIVDPRTLLVETAYQRDLSARSVSLIRKIVANWSWDKFKAVDVNEPVLTPSGWTTHGALSIGDKVFGPDGKPTRIVGRTPIYNDADCFRVALCDGYEVVVSGDHLWTVEIPRCGPRPARRLYRELVTISTRELKLHVDASITTKHYARAHPRIPVSRPIELPTRSDLPLDPYVLGVWLGDGGVGESRITAGAEDAAEMASNIEAAGVTVRARPQRSYFRLSLGGGKRGDITSSPVVAALRKIGVFRDKHIPDSYLMSGEHQRFSLFQGLMDTDGSCSNGRAVFCSANEPLAKQVVGLARSLGMRATIAERTPLYRGEPRSFWQVQFFAKHSAPPFRLGRKVAAVRCTDSDLPNFFRIVGIECVESRPVSCVQVEREDGLYLIGHHFVQTHNCPIVSETEGGLVIIDGQHTAIAAASHPAIRQIPVMVTRTTKVERRAAAFVSHNRDRLAMTPAQIFYGDLAAHDKNAMGVMECVVKTGASVPRLPVARSDWKPGQVSSVGEIRTAYASGGAPLLERMLRIAVASKVAPLSSTILKALRAILTDETFEKTKALPDEKIAASIAAIGDIATASEDYAAQLGLSRFRACAELIAQNAQ